MLKHDPVISRFLTLFNLKRFPGACIQLIKNQWGEGQKLFAGRRGTAEKKVKNRKFARTNVTIIGFRCIVYISFFLPTRQQERSTKGF